MAMTEVRGARSLPMPPFAVLVGWHGLLAAAFTIAWVSGDVVMRLHVVVGYIALGLLMVRLALALAAPDRSPWGLPWATKAQWSRFVAGLMTDPASTLAGRTPFTPLSGLAVLVTTVLAVLSGVLADVVRLDDPHEVMANAALVAVIVHLLVILGSAWLRRRRQAKRTP